MVKKKVRGRKRFKAAQGRDGSGSLIPPAPQPPPPKHLQRKITRKVGFLDKVASSQKVKEQKGGTGLNAKPVISKNQSAARRKQKASKAFSNLQSLSGALSEVEQQLQQLPSKKPKGQHGQRPFGQAVNSSRARKVVMVQESGRIQQVLKHPLFQSNPLQAITNHLQATLPPAPPPETSTTRVKQQQKKKKAKAKAKAAPEGRLPWKCDHRP